jgi:hypothetical protein
VYLALEVELSFIHERQYMKSAPVQVYFTDEDRGRLERLAERLGLSMAETLRLALRRLAAEALGEDDPLLRLAGSLESVAVPSDLSTRHDDYAVSGYTVPSPAPRVAESRRPRPETDD